MTEAASFAFALLGLDLPSLALPSFALPSFALLGIEFAAPWALAALALPVFVVLVSRNVEKPPALFTGAFELWLRLGARRPLDAHAAQRRVPPHVWLFAVGLAAAVFACAGPRPEWDAPREPWRVIVDRSPSMYLTTDAGVGRETRLAAALRLAVNVRADARADDAGVLWIDASAEPPAYVLARTSPTEWLTAPREPRAEPEWSRFDADGVLWLTDDASALAPAHASFAASGGAAAPGPIARRGGLRIDWDGAELREVRDELHAPRIALDARIAPEVQRFVRAWAEARELAVDAHDAHANETSADLVLTLRGAPAGDRAAPITRDGWTANARWSVAAPTSDELGALAVWLTAPDGTALVTSAPSRIHVAITTLDSIAGDPASFAVSWSELCDRACLPGADVVALRERASAGGALVRRQAPPPFATEFASAVARWRAYLTCISLVCVAVALAWAWSAQRGTRAVRVT